ncbi:MAG TPA: glycosyltransferase family 4 protein [Candidatus Andersenbacteria bacterium]|nr:glycosyltransferase family 4 protein [Candidatus Andersenbacteria bacterium]
MKIIVCSPYHPPHIGGLEKYNEELFSHLAAKGHSITIVTSNIPWGNVIEKKGNITVIRFPALDIIYNYPIPNIFSPVFWKLFYMVKTEQFDIIFSATRFFISTPIALIMGKIRKIPWIHIEHGSGYVISNNLLVAPIGRIYDACIAPFLFKHTSLTIAPSNSAQQFIKTFDQRKTPVIYRGVEYNNIAAIAPNSALKELYRGHTIITYVGRLISGKGLPDLFHAIAAIPQTTPIVLLLVGSGQERTELEVLQTNLHLDTRVRFLGALSHDESIGVMKISDIVVNPSYSEGLPTTILEAITCKTSVIATNVGGTAEILSPELSWFLYKPGDIASLTEKIQTLIMDASLRMKFSSVASPYIKQKFNWKSAASEYESHMKALV